MQFWDSKNPKHTTAPTIPQNDGLLLLLYPTLCLDHKTFVSTPQEGKRLALVGNSSRGLWFVQTGTNQYTSTGICNTYRVYTDACDYRLAGILQQVQPIWIHDLQGTKLYNKLKTAYEKGEPVPKLVVSVSKEYDNVLASDIWHQEFNETIIHIEQVIAYWS